MKNKWGEEVQKKKEEKKRKEYQKLEKNNLF